MNEYDITIQALTDGFGYPKSELQQKRLGASEDAILSLLDLLEEKPDHTFTTDEKQLILNCLEGALDYVDEDMPVLYNLTKDGLKKFLFEKEKDWKLKSSYHD